MGVQEGDRVRFATAHHKLERTGVIQRFGGDSMFVALTRGPGIVDVSFSDLRALALSLGPRTPGEAAKRGAVIGFLAGLTISTVAAGTVAYQCAHGAECYGYEALAVTFFSGIAILGGTLGGALFGVAVPGERWRRIETSPSRSP